MILYPQLPHAAAEFLGAERCALPIRTAALTASCDHPDVVFTPTGGARATADEIGLLRSRLLTTAESLGYPDTGDEQSRVNFDKTAAGILHSSMGIEPCEAAKSGVWEFATCVLACDLVRWRFPGGADGTPLERFLGGRRNAFQRLWWRAYVLQEEGATDPYQLLGRLGEDEIVQIMERPFLAGSRALARAVGTQLLDAANRHRKISRRVLIREVQKRLRRLAAFVSFEAIQADEVNILVRDLFDSVARSVC